MAKLTKKGALGVSQYMDRLAALVQADWQTLGLPEKIAMDYAYRTDLIADHIEKHAGLKREAAASNGGFDPSNIGKEVTGPLENITPPKEEWASRPDFTQEENRELRLRQQNGDLGMKTNPEQMPPQAGRQASVLRRQLEAAAINGTSPRLLKALALAAKIAEEEESKQAGEVPPEFLEQQKGKGEGEKKEEEGKPEEKKENPFAEKPEEKKAHGFNLSAE
jgi:hypothetical protein